MYTVRMRTGLSIMCGVVSVFTLIALGYESYRQQEALETGIIPVVLCFGIMMIYLVFYAIRKRVVVNVEGKENKNLETEENAVDIILEVGG